MRLQFGENSLMALDTVRNNKARSFLTVLGVVIGVGAMIFVASILVGVSRDVSAFLDDYGVNTFFIYRFDVGIRIGRLSAEERARKPLSLDDALAILDECPHVKAVTAEVFPRFDGTVARRPPPIVRFGAHEVSNIDFAGTTSAFQDVQNAQLAQGRFFTDFEDLHRADVAVIGDEINKALFPANDGVGQTVIVDGATYEVIGVLEKRKGTFLRDETADRVIRIPYHSYRRHYPTDDDNFLSAQAYPDSTAAAEDEIRGLLRRRRGVAFNKPDNFSISTPEAIAEQFRQIMSTVALMTIVVSSIGLLVGGVGVMNIMLMSVTERTHEIGVRKAIGAKRSDVIWQFLIEAIVLTGLGGLLGVIVGSAAAASLPFFFPTMPTTVPMWAVVVAVLMAMSVGLFFGIYPAVKAARLDPVEALRYE
jgi:putative ABC transport system permease protein